MIKSLSKLTMHQYIELVCGDTSVLLDKDEIVTNIKLQRARKLIIYEYARLSDDAGSKIFISDHTLRIRAKAELILFQCLNNAMVLGAFDDVRIVLKEYGIAREMTDNQLVAEVQRLLKRAKTNIKRYDDDQKIVESPPSPDEIRIQFDKQAAALMTFFKFQIDLNTIPATQFACMVDQAHKQIKAQLSAINKK